MEKKLICHGQCKNYFLVSDLTYINKTKRLCNSCLKERMERAEKAEQRRKEQEVEKQRKHVERLKRKELAEQKRIARETELQQRKEERERKRLEKEAVEAYKRSEAEKKRAKRERKREKLEAEKAKKAALTAEERERLEKAQNYLYSIICKTFNISYPTPMIIAQIRNFKNKYGFTDETIAIAWHKIVEVKGINNLESSYGIALVPYFHDNAVNEYKAQQERQANMRAIKPVKKAVVSKVQIVNQPTAREKLLQRNMVDVGELE